MTAYINRDKIFIAALLWKSSLEGDVFTCVDNKKLVVTSTGENAGRNSLSFSGAEIVVDSVRIKGKVVIGDIDNQFSDNVILQIVDNESCAPSYNSRGEMITQLVMPIRKELIDFYADLLHGCKSCGCSEFIKSEGLNSAHFFSSLLYERLMAKYEEVMRYHYESEQNWNQTLHLMFFRAMGSPSNIAPFVSIAKKLPYDKIYRLKSSLDVLESVLLGTSGLLQIRLDRHEYIQKLKSDYDYLCGTHEIMPLNAGDWDLYSGTIKGKPEIRLMQMANLFFKRDFLFDDIVRIKTLEQIYELFDCETSEFWRDIPTLANRVGKDRKEVLGINLIVPILFAYGKSIEDDDMVERSVELLNIIPAERNSLMNAWRKAGVKLSNAADSQSLLQLTKEYCLKRKCAECRFGKEQIRRKIINLSK